MAIKKNDQELYEDLKSLGYHIPDHCIDLYIDAPLESRAVVKCSYLLYKDEPINVDWGKAREAAKRTNEMTNDYTKEESFLEGVRWAVNQLTDND